MKIWFTPAVTLSLLLAAPAALAAPPDRDSSAQQDRQKEKKTDAGHKADGKGNDSNTRRSSGDGNSGAKGNRDRQDGTIGVRSRGDRDGSGDAGNRELKRNDDNDRNVHVKRGVEARRDVHVNRRVDLKVYRRNFNSPRRYHWNVYRRPAGWYAHRWTYGERLPRDWFVRDYWITGFLMYGLIAPPDGYVWVRVGDDALLIDTETGEVIRVVYDVFY